jgi:hypothetical protein
LLDSVPVGLVSLLCFVAMLTVLGWWSRRHASRPKRERVGLVSWWGALFEGIGARPASAKDAERLFAAERNVRLSEEIARLARERDEERRKRFAAEEEAKKATRAFVAAQVENDRNDEVAKLRSVLAARDEELREVVDQNLNLGRRLFDLEVALRNKSDEVERLKGPRPAPDGLYAETLHLRARTKDLESLLSAAEGRKFRAEARADAMSKWTPSGHRVACSPGGCVDGCPMPKPARDDFEDGAAETED